MRNTPNDRISIKLFIGFELTMDIRIQLSHSKLWKQASVSNLALLKETRFQDKPYLGFFLEQEMAPLKILENHATLIRKTIIEYDPAINSEALKFSLFPQVFVA